MNMVTQIFLPLALVIIMFTMGLGLTTGDFKQIIIKPKAFTLGILCQFLSLPLIAWFVASTFQLTGELAVGLMIIAVCPGGVTSNVYAKLSNGDVALSIALTAVTSLLSVVTIPFIVNWSLTNYLGANSTVELPIFQSIIAMFIITSLPVIAGMALKHKKSDLAALIEKKLSKVSVLLFVAIVLAAILKEKENFIPYMKLSGSSTLLLNLMTMIASFLLAWLIRLPSNQIKTIVLECGIQNGTLAIMIASTFLRNETMAIPGAIYSLQMFVTGGLVILIAKLVKAPQKSLKPVA